MKIHFIGIGGIGVSALAQYYLAKNHQVSGSDLVSSEMTDLLKKKGAKIFIGKHNPENLPQEVDLVIYSPAVKNDNPELKKAKQLKIKCRNYPQALGELTKKYLTIALAGAHGKSTTTAMVSLILTKAGLDPTVIIGTKLKEFGNSNFRIGKSEYLIIEADEWQASFLNYWPKIIVITNIDKEHLDYYKNLNHIIRTYKKFIGHLGKEGTLIINGKDRNVKKLIFNSQFSIFNFQTIKEKEKLKKLLKIPGQHNLSNALAALSVARLLKIPDETSFEALSEYQGAWRRFEEKDIKFSGRKIKIISDYGHHPTEISATILGAREKFKKQKICLIFQPHQYQRTFYLFKDFVAVFKKIKTDKTIITDIFDVAGREKGKIKKVIDSKKLAKAVKEKKTIYLPKKELVDYLKNNLKGGEIVIIMGAGDIYNLTKELSIS